MSTTNPMKKIDKELKEAMDEVYAIGFKNGGIEMKNKILKKINRDFSLFINQKAGFVAVKILKMVAKLK